MSEKSAAWETVAATVRARRSNLNVDRERPVPSDVIDDLIDLALWAPNHYRTDPFRIVVVTGAARERLGAVAAEAFAARPDAREPIVERQRVQFLRAPTVLAVAAAANEDPIKHAENRYTVAAGIQNLLLGAEALRLAGAWRSGAAMVDADVSGPVKAALGLEPDDDIIGFIYLGYPIAPPGVREKPTVRVIHLDR